MRRTVLTSPRSTAATAWIWMTLSMIISGASSAPAQDRGRISHAIVQNEQQSDAVLTGRVVTHSGAAVVNATVMLENLLTKAHKLTQTDEAGAFRLSGRPGDYQLRISAKGFKTFKVDRMPLVAGDLPIANVMMEPGLGSETISGSSNSVVSSLGTALAGKRLADLPENQRNFVNLVQVGGGANEGSLNTAGTAVRPGAQHDSSAVSLGGQPEQTNNSMIDGIDNNERINSQIALHPSVEGIQEVQVFASDYSAIFGHAGGGVINVVTKSGTDHFHGSVYEYFGNDALDTYPFQFGGQNRKPELRQNQFGGSLGGPLGHHKTLFFGDYEGFRLIQARPPLQLTVPTAYEHAHPGDFTDAGGTVLPNLDPVGLAYFNLYPLPNVVGSTNQFVSAAMGSNFSTIADLRVDQQLSQHDTLFARMSYNRTFVLISGQFPQVEEDGMTIHPGGFLYSFPGNMEDTASNLAFSYTHTFGSQMGVNVLLGYTRWRENDKSLNPSVAANAGFGQPGINLPETSDGLSPVNVVEASTLGNDGYYRPTNQGDKVLQYGVLFHRELGSNRVQAGGTLIHRDWDDIGSAYSLGTWVVQDLPSLLAGSFLQTQREVDLDHPQYVSWEPSAFLQDTWKILPTLSLHLGLRYDVFTQPVEADNRLSNFDTSTGQLLVAGQSGVSRTANVRTDRSNFGPRFGVSWQAHAHLVVDAGIGIVYFRPIDAFYYKAPPFDFSFGICSSSTCPSGFNTLASGLPFSSSPSVIDPSGFLLGMRALRFPSSSMQQFNFGIEEQAKGNTVRLFYVGAIGRHIARSFPDINAPPPNDSAAPDLLRPFYGTVPNLTSIGYFDTEGCSFYDALQASEMRTFHNGLSAQLNYTWAHGTDDVSGGGFGTVPSLSSKIDHGNSNYDVRHRLAATLFYNLPLGRSSKSLKGVLLRSWQLDFSGVWSTGLPFTVVNAADESNTNPGAYGADRPNELRIAAVSNAGIRRFFDTSAFVAQPIGTLGDERSNALYGPHNRHIDATIVKNFSIAKDKQLQFKAQMFNVTNTANFASPAAVLGGANFGQLTSLTAGYTPRQIQLAVHITF